MEMMSLMYPIIDNFLKLGIIFTKTFAPISFVVVSFMKILGKIKQIKTSAAGVSAEIKPIVTGTSRFLATLAKGGSTLSKFATILGKLSFVTPFLKFIPILGWTITLFQFFSSIVKNWGKGDFWYLIRTAIYDTFLRPFKFIYDWIAKHLGSGSPSEIMWSVIKGIVDAGSYIYDALTSPFRRFFAWLAEKIPFIGGSIAERIRGGATGALTDFGVLEKKAIVEPKKTEIVTQGTSTPQAVVTSLPTEQEQKQK